MMMSMHPLKVIRMRKHTQIMTMMNLLSQSQWWAEMAVWCSWFVRTGALSWVFYWKYTSGCMRWWSAITSPCMQLCYCCILVCLFHQYIFRFHRFTSCTKCYLNNIWNAVDLWCLLSTIATSGHQVIDSHWCNFNSHNELTGDVYILDS